MLQFPTWKYVVAALVIALSVFYSLPNLYPQDPAVQIAANRGSSIDDSLALRVRGALEAAKVEAKSVAVEGDNLVVRTANPEVQTQAADLLRTELGGPLLKLVRVIHDTDLMPVQHLTAYMSPAHSRILMDIPGETVNTLTAGQVVFDDS